MHCAHFSFDLLLGPHKGFLDLTECAHVHEFRNNLLTEFTVYLKIENVHWLAPPIVLLIRARTYVFTVESAPSGGRRRRRRRVRRLVLLTRPPTDLARPRFTCRFCMDVTLDVIFACKFFSDVILGVIL